MDLDEPTLERLSARFAPGEEKQREGRGRDSKLTYIDARAVMDRLDEVVGPANWHETYRVLYVGEPGRRQTANGRDIEYQSVAVECSLTVCGVTKSDCGEALEEDEGFKSAYSDAFKRAAVHFGIGRYLYGGAMKAALAASRPVAGPSRAQAITPSQPATDEDKMRAFAGFCRTIWPDLDRSELEPKIRHIFSVPLEEKVSAWGARIGWEKAMAEAEAYKRWIKENPGVERVVVMAS